MACDGCRYCKVQHVKRDQETYWKCRIMKFKEYYDSGIENFSVFTHSPAWCPLSRKEETACQP